ncbi:MAG TPA: UrcA family protein [Gammaproteobacteria bacterium]|nr:UrcA family protein [Gammaproteobacteria bacterium]
MFKLIAGYAPAIAAFGMLTSGSFGANAETPGRATATPSITVSYADLNLNTRYGVEALYARLRSAAREVCNVRERQALAGTLESKTCYRRALGAAVDKLNALRPEALRPAGIKGDEVL